MVRICHPLGDGISSVVNLLDSVVLRVAIWVVALVTCTGNAFVIVCRLLLHVESNSHSLFIKNLAGSLTDVSENLHHHHHYHHHLYSSKTHNTKAVIENCGQDNPYGNPP